MDGSNRLPVLDGLRALSILLVLAGHMIPLGPKLFALNATTAAMGMSLFFALSGFLITSGLLRNASVEEFLIRRLARIVPLVYAYIFFVYTFLYFNPTVMAYTASFLLNYFPEYIIAGGGYNGHLWSLCVEVQFYLAIALTVLVAGRQGIWLVWLACFTVTVLRVRAGEVAYISIYTHHRVDEILVGACFATLYARFGRVRLEIPIFLKSPIFLISVTTLIWFCSSSPHAGWFQYFRPYATILMFSAVVLHRDTWLGRILASAPLRYVATISYALYVVHPATMHGWWNEGSNIERYLFKRPISVAMTFIAAHISTFYWERPWQLAAKNMIVHRRQRRSANGGTVCKKVGANYMPRSEDV